MDQKTKNAISVVEDRALLWLVEHVQDVLKRRDEAGAPAPQVIVAPRDVLYFVTFGGSECMCCGIQVVADNLVEAVTL